MFDLPWWAGVIELVTGLLLIVGFHTRAAAFLASGTMAAAYWLAHAPQSPHPAVNGGDAAILYCFIFFYLIFAGGGPLSVDALRGGGKPKPKAKAKPAETPETEAGA